MPHDLSDTNCWNLNKYMDEQNIAGVGLRESKVPFTDCIWKILIRFKHIFYPNINVSESISLY